MGVTTGPIYEVGAQYVEQLNYSNPLGRPVQPVWYVNERYFAIDSDYQVVWTHTPAVSTKEYLFYYGTPAAPGPQVAGQFPVYNRIPGSYYYFMTVEVVQVFVPQGYQPNSLRSETAVLKTDYPIVETGTYFVRPVL